MTPAHVRAIRSALVALLSLTGAACSPDSLAAPTGDGSLVVILNQSLVKVIEGGHVSMEAQLVRQAGSDAAPVLSVDELPAHMKVQFAKLGDHGDTTFYSIIITADSLTALGEHGVVFRGHAPDLENAETTLPVYVMSGFLITPVASSITLSPGQTAEVEMDLPTTMQVFSIQWTFGNLPAGVTATVDGSVFLNPKAGPPNRRTLRFTAASNTPIGSSVIRISGKPTNMVQRSANITLQVAQP